MQVHHILKKICVGSRTKTLRVKTDAIFQCTSSLCSFQKLQESSQDLCPSLPQKDNLTQDSQPVCLKTHSTFLFPFCFLCGCAKETELCLLLSCYTRCLCFVSCVCQSSRQLSLPHTMPVDLKRTNYKHPWLYCVRITRQDPN